MSKQSDQTATSERDGAVDSAVVALLDVAVVLGSSTAGFKCILCGQHQGNHTIACPVPALEEWINPSVLD